MEVPLARGAQSIHRIAACALAALGAHVWPVWESTIGDAMKYIFRYSARPAMTGPGR